MSRQNVASSNNRHPVYSLWLYWIVKNNLLGSSNESSTFIRTPTSPRGRLFLSPPVQIRIGGQLTIPPHITIPHIMSGCSRSFMPVAPAREKFHLPRLIITIVLEIKTRLSDR